VPKKPGPPKQSADVIRIRGNRSKLTDAQLREREAAEVKPAPVAPRVPKDLDVYERECWDMHAPELDRLGLLTALDGASFRFACTSYSLARHSLDAMKPRTKSGAIDRRKKGYQVVINDPAHGGGLRRHPAFLTYRQAASDYRAWCTEFGLTPSARVSLRPAAGPMTRQAADEDDDDAFFGS